MNKLIGEVSFFVIFIATAFASGCRDKDGVLPPQNLWELIEAQKELSILENAILLAGLQPLFEEQGPYTVFAPTNEAFLVFFEEFNLAAGLADLAPQDLQIVVLYHIIDNRLKLETFDEEEGHPTLFNGFMAFIERKTLGVVANDVSKVMTGDFEASNGLLHVVDHTFFIIAEDGSIGIPGADGGQVGGGNNPNRKGP